MKRVVKIGLATGLCLVAAGAASAEDRDLCTDRPGKTTPACTLDAGKVQIEAGALDFQHSKDSDETQDIVTTGDLLLRYGLAGTTEVDAQWSGYGWARTRDRHSGAVEHVHGSGDLTLSVRQNLAHPDSKGTAFSLQPFVTLPVGRAPIGDATWSSGLIAPVGFDLAPHWRMTMSPEIDAAANEESHGRHLAYAMAAEIRRSIGEAFEVSAEGWVERDQDPSGHQTLATVDLNAAWQPDKNSQIDVATLVGVNAATPRLELQLGYSHRF